MVNSDSVSGRITADTETLVCCMVAIGLNAYRHERRCHDSANSAIPVWKAVVDVPCNLQRVVEDSTTRCRLHGTSRTAFHNPSAVKLNAKHPALV